MQDFDVAFKYICLLLARREYSTLELNKKLSVKGYNSEIKDEVINKAIKLDIQSNARFASMIARTRLFQGYGSLRIILELKSHNLSQDVINNALLEISAEYDSIIMKLCIKKKFKEQFLIEGVNHKTAAWFLKRGFSLEQIKKAFDK